jgi:uncharacterized spore protein YtfJ
MDVQQALSNAGSAITAKRVFGKPYERDGVVVIPAAKIRGGGGGGGGTGTSGEGEGTASGSGFGFGLDGHPVGAYVIKNGKVKWKPALDLNSLLFRTQALLLVGLLIAGGRTRKRRRRRR